LHLPPQSDGQKQTDVMLPSTVTAPAEKAVQINPLPRTQTQRRGAERQMRSSSYRKILRHPYTTAAVSSRNTTLSARNMGANLRLILPFFSFPFV
jgi:hypothetical protein